MQCKISAFTLLELLVVISLITILIFLTFPVWHLLEKRETLYGSRSLLLSTFEQARLAALQQHAATWVVLRHHHDQLADDFRIFQETEDGTIKPLSSWNELPHHIAFELTPRTIMSEIPPQALMEIIKHPSVSVNKPCHETVGSLQYNGEGIIVVPKENENALLLYFSNKRNSSSINDLFLKFGTIHFSRWSGRAF